MQRIWRMGLAASAVMLATGALQGALAQGQKAPKQVVVRVEYFEVMSADYVKASKDIPAGQEHDGLLIAALIKAGVKPVMAPQVQTAEKVPGHIETSDEFPYDTADGQHQVMKAISSLDVNPRFNSDGTITSDLKFQHEAFVPVAGSPLPSKTSNVIDTRRTLRDGEVREIGSLNPGLSSDKTSLIFLKMTTASDKS